MSVNTISAKNLPEPFYRQWAEGRRAACKAIISSPVCSDDTKADARKKLDALKAANGAIVNTTA